jgi:hypothetical protein
MRLLVFFGHFICCLALYREYYPVQVKERLDMVGGVC